MSAESKHKKHEFHVSGTSSIAIASVHRKTLLSQHIQNSKDLWNLGEDDVCGQNNVCFLLTQEIGKTISKW